MYMTTLKPDVYMTIKRDRKGEGAVEELVASSDILCMHVNSGTLYIHDNPDNLCTWQSSDIGRAMKWRRWSRVFDIICIHDNFCNNSYTLCIYIPILTHYVYLMCDMPHPYVWHAVFICVTWRIHMCDMTHPYVWHAAFICMWHDAFICVTWLVHMCDMPHSYAWHDAFIYMWHDSFVCVTWRIWMCDVTYSSVWRVSVIFAT